MPYRKDYPEAIDYLDEQYILTDWSLEGKDCAFRYWIGQYGKHLAGGYTYWEPFGWAFCILYPHNDEVFSSFAEKKQQARQAVNELLQQTTYPMRPKQLNEDCVDFLYPHLADYHLAKASLARR